MLDETTRFIALDKQHVWHPFTQMTAWLEPEHEPLVLVSGRGAWLKDSRDHRYLDGNSSIWTNIHGHAHPRIDEAIRRQLDRVAHTSFLGFTNPAAAELADELVKLVPGTGLTKVFFSDNGSTGIEVAIKMAIQYFQQNGRPEKKGFVGFQNAYHGDTLGASSVGGIPLFHERFQQYHVPVTHIPSVDALPATDPSGIAGLIIEPLIQGAAGMALWPEGMLRILRDWCDRNGVLLIFDEVMTGFGRTGKMFAFQNEEVFPDFLVLAKGLTGGYLPLAATLTTQTVFDGFLGKYEELRTFFYGHSYAGNALGCAAALASLSIFHEESTLQRVNGLIAHFAASLESLRDLPWVYAIRRCGFVAGIEVRNEGGMAFDWRRQVGEQICRSLRDEQLLTRPIRDVIVLMLPFCVLPEEVTLAVKALGKSIAAVCRKH